MRICVFEQDFEYRRGGGWNVESPFRRPAFANVPQQKQAASDLDAACVTVPLNVKFFFVRTPFLKRSMLRNAIRSSALCASKSAICTLRSARHRLLWSVQRTSSPSLGGPALLEAKDQYTYDQRRRVASAQYASLSHPQLIPGSTLRDSYLPGLN